MTLVSQHPDEKPIGYPGELEQDIVVADGTTLWVRPIVPSDARVLAAEFAVADDDTVYQRFFTPGFALTADRLRYLTEIDYTTHLAVAAMTPDGPQSTGVAIGRYVARSDDDVEAAVVVKPEYRRRGIGRAILELLASAAAARGFRTMSASYLAANEGAGRLLNSGGYSAGIIDGDTGIVETTRTLDVDPAPAGSV